MELDVAELDVMELDVAELDVVELNDVVPRMTSSVGITVGTCDIWFPEK